MSELRKIAIGLLGLSHPEIQRLRTSDSEAGPLMTERRALKATGSKLTFAAMVLRSVKFAFAAPLLCVLSDQFRSDRLQSSAMDCVLGHHPIERAVLPPTIDRHLIERSFAPSS